MESAPEQVVQFEPVSFRLDAPRSSLSHQTEFPKALCRDCDFPPLQNERQRAGHLPKFSKSQQVCLHFRQQRCEL